MPDIPPLNPEKIIKALASHKVKYVLIGALAARLQGFPRMTADADITPERNSKNLQRLAKALTELNARVYTDDVPKGLPFNFSAETLKQNDFWNLVTAAGRLDIAFEPSGTKGYHDLKEKAVRFEVFGATLFTSNLNDIIRSKKAAGRPQDLQDIIILREMLNRE